jgi:hypothetical protein
MIRVRNAVPTGGFGVRLTLTDGRVVERSLDAVLWGPVFDLVRRDPATFAALTVEAGTVTWPGGADIDPDVLIWGGPAPSDPTARPPKFLRLAGRQRGPVPPGAG